MVEYTYDTWGKLISITGSLASTIGVKNPLRYRGYYYDTETSLYYLQARYYDPDTGRFISPDALPVAGNDYIQGLNRYAYCYNNPVMYSDPTGYSTEGLYEAIASIVMLSGLTNIGFVWWEPIIKSDYSYEVIYGITEDVANTLNWFYEIYDYEENIGNSRILMDKITNMCTAISQEIGVTAIDVMSTYFTAEKIGLLFELYGDKFKEKIADIESDLSIAGGGFVISALVTGASAGIGFWAGIGGMGYSFAEINKIFKEFNLWKEIISLNPTK